MLGYSYNTPKVGYRFNAGYDWADTSDIPKNGVCVGYIHSHPPGAKEFSPGDQNWAKYYNISAYVAVSENESGVVSVKKYANPMIGFQEWPNPIASNVAYKPW